jgi:hypothetical protein
VAPALLYGLRMKTTLSLLSLILFSGPLFAQSQTSYQVVYKSCARADSPIVVRPYESEWFLVVKGGDKMKEADCHAFIATLAARRPELTNITYKNIKSEEGDVLKRGFGKKNDIYCKYDVTGPVRVADESEACGISHVDRGTDPKVMNLDDAKNCVSMATNTQTQLWQKLACVLDATEQAVNIPGMDGTTYEGLKFQTVLVSEKLSRSLNMPLKAVLAHASSQPQ